MKSIHSEINRAETLPSSFYTMQENYDKSIENIFVRSWQYIGDRSQLLKSPENVFPVTLLDQSIGEPLILETSGEEIQCMSNVCTHRGFQIVHHPAKLKKIICGYHGRRFDLLGKMEYMPEFQEAEDFPRPCDHLTQLPIHRWKRFLFTGIDPKIDFSVIKDRLEERMNDKGYRMYMREQHILSQERRTA